MIEFEMTIPAVEIEDARRRLRECGAALQQGSHIQKHIVFNLPEERKIKGGWMRVREESDRVTMSLKIIDGNNISDQQEYFFIAENTEDACKFLTLLGGIEKARQEKRREIWMLGQCEVTIDEWPFLDPFLEVEGKNEEMVKEAVELLGYEYDKCRVCAVDTLYSEKYGVSEDIVDNHTPLIMFDMVNPFLS
jgi:adenylate cyclase, class 2